MASLKNKVEVFTVQNTVAGNAETVKVPRKTNPSVIGITSKHGRIIRKDANNARSNYLIETMMIQNSSTVSMAF